MKKAAIVLAVVVVYAVVAWSQGLWPFSSTAASLYTNAKYGFELTMPTSWRGYTAVEEGGTIFFSVPTSAADWDGSVNMMAITATAPATAKPASGKVIGTSATHVFSLVYSQEQPPADAAQALADREAVVASFRLTK